MVKKSTGLSSSTDKLIITDASLCGLQLSGVETQALRAYYRSLLELGIAYVQVPCSAVTLLTSELQPGRTVLSVPEDCKAIPPSFAGYLCTREVAAGATIIECAWGSTPPAFADEIRWTADSALFFQDYTAEFSKMTAECEFCPRNADDFGTALAVEWLLEGGRRLTAAFMGTGDYAPLEEVLAALHVYGILPPSMRLEKLPGVAEAYRQLTKTAIPEHKAVLGSALFEVESGVHVDGIAKNRHCYEPFAPESVGAARRIVIGKHSGKQSLKLKLEELGLRGICDLDQLLHLVREQSMHIGGSLNDEIFAALARKAAGGNKA